MVPCCELLRVEAHAINSWSSWLEGCKCHEHIWLSRSSHLQKMRLLFEQYGLHACHKKGCRGDEMAAFAVQKWLQKIRDADSTHLNLMLARLGNRERAVLASKLHALKELLVEILSAKFEMWNHLPYLLLGLECSDTQLAKDCAKRACAEWSGCDNQARAHRVAQRYFKNPVVCKQLHDFAASSKPLSDFPELCNLSLQYGRISLIERAIESVHAKIEKETLGRRYMTPPSLCSRIRSSYLHTFMDNPRFVAWCRGRWERTKISYEKHESTTS